jgi:hypothetical protein
MSAHQAVFPVAVQRQRDVERAEIFHRAFGVPRVAKFLHERREDLVLGTGEDREFGPRRLALCESDEEETRGNMREPGEGLHVDAAASPVLRSSVPGFNASAMSSEPRYFIVHLACRAPQNSCTSGARTSFSEPERIVNSGPDRRATCRAAKIQSRRPCQAPRLPVRAVDPSAPPARRLPADGAGAAASLEEMKPALSHARFGQLLCR